MAATMEAPLVGASDVAELLEPESEPLTAAEAAAIVADMLRRAALDPPRPIGVERPCRCRRPWIFERGHCSACGHDLGAVAA